MKTPIRYYGGKIKMIPHLLPLIPSHKVYCEPFFGGGAVFFAKHPGRTEVINDTNGFVINFYEVVQRNFVALHKKITATLHSKYTYDHAVHIYDFPHFFTALERAWALWILANMSFLALGDNFMYSKNGSNPARTTANKRAKLSMALQRRLAKVIIERRDALEIIPRYDTEDSFFYVDPPYINTNQGHYSGYLEDDYALLLRCLSRIQGKFLLSSFPNAPLTEAIKEHKWTVRQFVMHKSSSRSSQRKTEVVASNYA